MNYLVVNVGCIECGVSSNVVALLDNKETALKLASKLNDSKEASWREGGQNSYEVFDCPEVNVINPEYADYLDLELIDTFEFHNSEGWTEEAVKERALQVAIEQARLLQFGGKVEARLGVSKAEGSTTIYQFEIWASKEV